jgi:serine/threonine-protein kinase HipA
VRSLDVRFTTSPLEVPRLVGTLLDQGGRIFFEYAEAWLETGLNLSPFRLPFERGAFEHGDRAFGPLPGLFADSLPDGWGLLLMDRHFRRLGLELASLGPLERLAWLGTGTMGALTYHPPVVAEADAGGALDLEALARQSQALLSGKSSLVLPQLLRAGGSPGGARPKILVGFKADGDELLSGADDVPEGFEQWLIKFPAREDPPGAGAAEYAYSLMARAAGLDLPATRLFATPEGGRYFGVQRFDRERNRRCHVHSFGNLLQTDFRVPSCDYLDLLQATAVLTRDHREVLKALRLMVFNVCAHNRDDHAKNFAFRLDHGTGAWSLSPAYDLCFSPGPGGEHTMTVAGEGRAPGSSHILRAGLARDVSRAEVLAIVDQVRAAVARWPEFAGRAGVGKARVRQIGGTLGLN